MVWSLLRLLAFLFFPLPTAPTHLPIGPWILSLTNHNANEVASLRGPASSANLEQSNTVCDSETRCPQGFFCDHHFGLCLTLRKEGEYCRRNAHCAKGLSCMFGKCQETIPNGQEGAHCLEDKDCAPSACCARLHGEMICQKRLLLNERCYVPQGGLGFSMNQVCPCQKGLVCRKMTPHREVPFEYSIDRSDWRCQKN
ncbi:dickkopf-related protein 2 [Pogona vitticeps]